LVLINDLVRVLCLISFVEVATSHDRLALAVLGCNFRLG
jgi:hypothetical protein